MSSQSLSYGIGSRVRAFHPGRFGVVNEGTVVGLGPKYARIDFGELLGGTFRVPLEHVLEVLPDDPPHVGHFSRLGGTYWCDTCNSPYCELA